MTETLAVTPNGKSYATIIVFLIVFPVMVPTKLLIQLLSVIICIDPNQATINYNAYKRMLFPSNVQPLMVYQETANIFSKIECAGLCLAQADTCQAYFYDKTCRLANLNTYPGSIELSSQSSHGYVSLGKV